MKRILRGVLAVTLVGTVAASSVQAQARGYVGFGGGVSIPTGDFADGNTTGWMGQVIAGITGPTGVVGGRISGSYIRHSIDDPLIEGNNRIIGAMGDVVFSPGLAEAKLRPYLLGGVGFQNGKADLDGVSGEQSETEFAFNFGAGVTIAVGRIKVFAEGRWLSIRTEGEAVNLIPLTIGLRFGGN